MTSRRILAFVVTAALADLAGGCQSNDKDALAVFVSVPQQSFPNVAKATIVVDYSGTGASILADGAAPDCAFVLPGVDGAFSDDHRGTLTIHASGPRALRGPADIAACRMRAAADATPASVHDKLAVRVTAAEDAAGKAVDLSGSKAHATARTEASIEAEQAEAVKASEAAAAAAPPPPAAPGAPGAAGAGGPGAAPAGTQGPAKSESLPPPGSAAAVAARLGTPPPLPFGAANAPPGSRPAANAATASAKPAPSSLINNPRGSASGNNSGNQNGSNNSTNPPPQENPVGSGGGGSNVSDNAPQYDLVISANSTGQATFGALQLEVTYLGSNGKFVGLGADVDCTGLVDAIIAANNVNDVLLKLGIISLQGVRIPAPLVRCGFKTSGPISTASFQIQIVDASDAGSEPLDPPPAVFVSSVSRR
ncbi:MAG TPA: hypothetical protein VGK20_18760 [Candidatus Binatia bacterium]